MDIGKKMKGDHSSGELVESLVSVRRVAKVVRGGRRFAFSVLAVVGDGKGRVGYGIGKHLEVSAAKNKAVNSAKKNMIRVHLRESRTLHHDIQAKFCASRVILRSASVGTGIIAGGSGRALFEVLGIQDIVVKSLGSSNPHNYIRAIFSALSKISSPRQIAGRRNKKIAEIIEKRR